MNIQSIYKSPAGKREIMALYDAVLARWPVAHETFNLPTRDGDTFIIASGEKSAPPLAWIPTLVGKTNDYQLSRRCRTLAFGQIPALSPLYVL